MTKVQKRDHRIVDYHPKKIYNAVMSAMEDSIGGIDEKLCYEVMIEADEQISNTYPDTVTVEQIQDIVEEVLMDTHRKDAARQFITYRSNRNAARADHGQYYFIDDEFFSKYKHDTNPIKTQLGNFVYTRTYSRFLPEEQRREKWYETVRRAVEYNCSLAPTPKDEAQKLFDNIYNLKQFPSGRTMWVGSTPVAHTNPMSNFNCSFTVIDNYGAFKDIFYLLMLGSGVGFRILFSDVEKLPAIRNQVNIVHEDYEHDPDKKDLTTLEVISNETVKLIVGDSKEGWSQAIEHYFKLLYSHEYRDIKTIIINYDYVRPKGEKLKTFGGTASGHESLRKMFTKIDRVLKTVEQTPLVQLRPIHCLDIANIIAENVVSGGVRRSSEIALIDPSDTECIQAKNDLYIQIDGKWQLNPEISHRQMSNNSIFYQDKPSREQLHWNFEQLKMSGDPAFINGASMLTRNPNAMGCNPCGEIILDSDQQCNLSTVNVFAFVQEDGTLDKDGLHEAQYLSARMNFRMTCIDLELPHWNVNHKRDRLMGCSLTGWQDMVNATDMTKDEEKQLLHELKVIAHKVKKDYAAELGVNEPLLATTVKPEGTLSLLPTVSAGVHYSHSPYYIRRVRISANDPLCKVCEMLNYPVYPEVGQDEETCVTKYIEFPVQAPDGRTKYDVSAIEQLENYRQFMKYYVDHNCSITVSVRPDEWGDVEQWMWDNWEIAVGVTFIALSEHFHEAMPYEAISKEEYERRTNEMVPFIQSLLSKFEKEETQLDLGDEGCTTGACPVR